MTGSFYIWKRRRKIDNFICSFGLLIIVFCNLLFEHRDFFLMFVSEILNKKQINVSFFRYYRISLELHVIAHSVIKTIE